MDNRRNFASVSKARKNNRYLIDNDVNINRVTANFIPWILVTVPLVALLRYLNIFHMPVIHLVIYGFVAAFVSLSTALVNRMSSNSTFKKYYNILALSLGVFAAALMPRVGIWITFILSTIISLFYIDPLLTMISAVFNYVLMLVSMWFRVASWVENRTILGIGGRSQIAIYISYILGLTIEFVVVVPMLYYIAKTEEEHIIREDNLMAEVRSDEERYSLAFENSNDIIFDYDYIKDEFVSFGTFDNHENGKSAGKTIYSNFITMVLNPGKKIYPLDVEKIRFFMEGKLTGPIEFRYHKNEDDEYRWFSVEGQIVYSDETGDPERGVGRIKDITDEKREEQNLLERVARDRVTNFILWDVGLRLLSQKTADEGANTAASICYIHFNNLKEISDSQGRVFMEAVIERIAENIRAFTEEADLKIRISENSFAVYFNDPMDDVLELFDSRMKEALESININKGEDGKLDYSLTYFHGLADLMDSMPMEEKFQMNAGNETQKDNSYFGDIIPFVFNVLQRSTELQSAVDMTLNRISNQFDIDYIHILERDSTTTLENFSCIAEFDRSPRLGCPFLGRKFNVDKDDFEKAKEMLEHESVIRVNSGFFDRIKGDTADFLDTLNTSGLLCFLRSEDEIRGCIYYEKNDKSYEWPQELVDALSELSSIIASFILKQMADQASAAKSNFLSSMSHEIRTPMNAIAGFSELILSEKNISEKTKNYAGNIRSSANNLLGIINQILDFSKIESGKFEIIEDDYAVSSLLNDITSIIGVQISEKPVRFIVNIGKHIPEGLYGDVMRIRQIFINILNNSVKYTDRGEIELNVDWKQKDQDSGELIASVRDTGIGIKDEDMPKLFESFMQIDTRRNRGITGTGLGLAVCKNLINLMNGHIEVKSVYGEGSTFSFSIPQKVIDPSETSFVYGEVMTAPGEFALSFVCPDVRILVVDDNRVNLEVAKGLMSRYGADIDEAMSGAEALARLEDNGPYDVIFMDHMMPGMDGIETTVKIREEGYTLPVIALTANAIKGVEAEFLNAGMNDYLTKPIELKRLEEIMDRWIPENRKKTSPDEISRVSDRVNAPGAMPGEPDPENAPWLSALKHVNTDAGLKSSLNDPEMYKTLLTSFIDSNDPELLNSELEGRDLNAYQVSVHALKSSSRYIGAERLSELARVQEELAKERNEEEVKKNQPELIRLLEEVLSEVRDARELFESGNNNIRSDGVTEVLSREDGISRLNEISSLLKDMESDEAEEKLMEFLSFDGIPGEVVSESRKALGHIRDFDYDEGIDAIGNALRSW